MLEVDFDEFPSSWYDAGAVSVQSITAGDGYMEFTPGNTTTWRMIGLGNGNAAIHFSDIEYAFFVGPSASLQIYEAGVLRGSFGTYAATDRLRVAVEGGVVKYRKNGVLVYTSTVSPSYPLLVDTSFNTVNSAVYDVVISSAGTANINWLVTDQLGTPRMIFDKTGSLANVKRHDYLPFGEELAAAQGLRTTGLGYTGDTVRQKFTLKERDIETGLDYFLARYYSSTQGRFTSTDPLLASGMIDDPQSWNRYAYTVNNPLRYIDPTGMWDWDVSAGGSYTDEQLESRRRDKSLTKSERKAAKRAIEFRQRFRAAREEAQNAASSNQLTQDQQQQVGASVGAYGSENDSNGVIVGVRNGGRGRNSATTLLNEDDVITVMFSAGLKGDKLAVVLAHEGRHVGDAQAWVGDFHSILSSFNFNHYEREQRAWNVSSNTAQPLNLRSYGPSGGGSEYEVWNRGWRQADRETKRSRGVERVMRYSGLAATDTDRYTQEHQHLPVP